jgi:hypothetical protein
LLALDQAAPETVSSWDLSVAGYDYRSALLRRIIYCNSPSPNYYDRVKRFLRLACVAALLAVMVFMAGRCGFNDQGPTYAARSLRDWLELYHYDPGNIWPPNPNGAAPQSVAAAYAVSQIGTNALPWLLRWTSCEDEDPFSLKLALKLVRPSRPNDLRDRAIKKAFRSREAINADLAFEGVRILGSNASPAIPELTRLLHTEKGQQTRWRCEMMLACVGAEGIPPLFSVVTNRDLFDQGAIGSIEMFSSPTNLLPAVPVLCGWLKDERISFQAKRALLPLVRRYPGIAFCVLTNDLAVADGDLKFAALRNARRN